MAVLGFARGHSFDGAGPLSRIGRLLYPQLILRPAVFRGMRLHLDPSDISHMVVAEEFVIDNVYELTRLPFTPDVVFDCGAHIGMFTIQAAAAFPHARITAFEPNPENLRWLRRQVAVNRLAVDVVPAAVSTRAGQARFAASCSLGGALERGEYSSEAVTVSTVRLCDYFEGLEDQRVLLKLDVEGEEERLLPEIVPSLPRVCAIFLETHGGPASWSAAAGLLEGYGFRTWASRRRGAYTDGFACRG